jgi:hypothetical protein
MTTHHLKTWPEPFEAVWDGRKTFELRRNDRAYTAGDVLVLQEWFPGEAEWGERVVRATVAYVIEGQFGLQPGHVCMALADVTKGYAD